MYFTLAVSAPGPRHVRGADRARLRNRPARHAHPGPGPGDLARPGRPRRPDHLGRRSQPGPAGHSRGSSGPPGVSGYTAPGSADPARATGPRASRALLRRDDLGVRTSRRDGVRAYRDHPGRPRFVARAGRATVLSDRATWAAAVTGRLGDADALLYAGLLGPGYPLGAVTPFAGVRALGPATSCRVAGGEVTETERAALTEPGLGGPDAAARVAEALVQAVMPLRDVPRAGRAEPDRRQGQPPDRRRAGPRRGAGPRPHLRLPRTTRTWSSRRRSPANWAWSTRSPSRAPPGRPGRRGSAVSVGL